MVSWVGLPWWMPNLGHLFTVHYHCSTHHSILLAIHNTRNNQHPTIVVSPTLQLPTHFLLFFHSHFIPTSFPHNVHPLPPITSCQLPNLPPIPHHTLHINPPPFHLPSVPSPKWSDVPSLCPTRCLVPRVPSAPPTPFIQSFIQSQSRVDPYDTRNHLSRREAILFVYTASELQDTTNGGSVVDGPGVSVVDVVGRGG